MENNSNPFVTALKNDAKWKTTENGCPALNTTSSCVLDLFANIGALRCDSKNGGYFDQNRLERMFVSAYTEDAFYTMRTVFYARDIRKGLGERDIPRYLFKYMATHYSDAFKNNVQYIPEYGRFDDWYELVNTPLEDTMWKCMKQQFESDLTNLAENKPISLLAKWIKTPDTSSKESRKLGCLTAEKLGYSVYDFKRVLKNMRKHLKIVEAKMSNQEWDEIVYSEVPSNAMSIYGKHAFRNHDNERFTSYLADVKSGTQTINSATLYPYDICATVFDGSYSEVAEAQWKALPDWVNGEYNALVMADTSGSMRGRPLCTALSLALYYAEHNKGAYHNMFMTFSNKPECVTIRGNNLREKFITMSNANWDSNTDLYAAFVKILQIAVDNHIAPELIPRTLIVISDMEIDYCVTGAYLSKTTFTDKVKDLYSKYGYVAPSIVYWNVSSRQTTMHADKDAQNVMLVSGQAASTFESVVSGASTTPLQKMYEILDNERYSVIQYGDCIVKPMTEKVMNNIDDSVMNDIKNRIGMSNLDTFHI